MTLEQYIIKVMHGEIVIPPPPPVIDTINRGIDRSDMAIHERDYCIGPCDRYSRGYICTRPKGHEGPHVARLSGGTYCHHWD
jgi:hypothetical protein